MAKYDYYDVHGQIGNSDKPHYNISLRVLFEDGDNKASVIKQATDTINREGKRIAKSDYVKDLENAL